MWWIEGLLGFLLLTVLVYYQRKKEKKEKKKFPPGPFAWPITGHSHLFSNLPHRRLRDASKRYGHLLGLRLGQQRAVVVSSPELAKLVLLTHDKLFADRPPFAFTSDLFFGSTNGVAFTRYGPQWRKHRKLCVLHLFTPKRLQELQHVRQQELRTLLLYIHDQSASGAALDIGRSMGRMASRLIMRLLQSKATMQVGDENLQLLMREMEQQICPTLGDFIPSLSWLDFLRKRRMRRIHARLDKVCTAMIREYKVESAGLCTDLLDAFLSQEEPLAMDEMKGIIIDMIAAGIHTTALTLEWAMTELLRNPRCLSLLQREVDTQLGMEKKLITDEDLPSLSYLKCVVKEVFRLHPAVPLLMRLSLEECQVQGYTIPAETLVYVNVWAIGRDEQVWPKASEFIPERFENSDIDLKGQHFEVLPFGSGRRSCAGMPLALSVIETTLANLVSWFEWELPEGEACTSINMDEKVGLAANKAAPMFAVPKPRVSLSKFSEM